MLAGLYSVTVAHREAFIELNVKLCLWLGQGRRGTHTEFCRKHRQMSVLKARKDMGRWHWNGLRVYRLCGWLANRTGPSNIICSGRFGMHYFELLASATSLLVLTLWQKWIVTINSIYKMVQGLFELQCMHAYAGVNRWWLSQPLSNSPCQTV